MIADSYKSTTLNAFTLFNRGHAAIVEYCPNILIGLIQIVLNTDSLRELKVDRRGTRELMLNSYASVWHAWLFCKPTSASEEMEANMEAKHKKAWLKYTTLHAELYTLTTPSCVWLPCLPPFPPMLM